GYEYDAAKKNVIKRLSLQRENFFLTRKMTIEKFEIDRRAEERVFAHPFIDLLELLNRHLASEEEVFRLQIQPLNHVLLGGVVLVTGRDRVAVDAEIGKE